MQFTRNYFERLKSLKMQHPLYSYLHECSTNDAHDSLFQILIIDDTNPHQSETKLVYGNREFFKGHYKGVDTHNLPTKGAEVDPHFAPKNNMNYPTIRFLLQSRRLSQMMASTWINYDETSDTNCQPKYVKKIFDSFNINPRTYWGTDLVEDDILYQILLEAKEKSLVDYLIQPTSVGYSSISLALLLSGQAYYVDFVDHENKENLKKIGEPIFSTYEMIWEYAIDLSWDTFYATRKDISQSGNNPRPPFTQVTLSYPPRPSEFNLKEKSIQDWVFAPEHADEIADNQYPFYPTQDTQEWKNKKIKFIVPPFPYIPLSST